MVRPRFLNLSLLGVSLGQLSHRHSNTCYEMNVGDATVDTWTFVKVILIVLLERISATDI